MYPIINLLGRSIGSYALMSLIGFFVCATVIVFTKKLHGIDIDDIIPILLVIIGGLFAGGHLLYGLVNIGSLCELLSTLGNLTFKQILSALGSIFGGMVFYGGFLGGLFALWIYRRFKKGTFKRDLLDLYAFSIPLFHTFGRLGCFLAGCCYGIESKFGFTVNNNLLVPEINGVNRFPVPLLEAVCNLAIFFVIFALFYKGKFQGKLIYVYMLIYPLVRFLDEFLRDDGYRGIYFGLSTSQWISIILFTFVLFKTAIFIKNKKPY